MATKAEYLSALEAKVFFRGAEVEDRSVRDITAGALRKYDVRVLMEGPDDTFMDGVQSFLVYGEGTASEEARRYHGNDRKSVSAFRTGLDTFLAGKLSSTVLKIVVDQVNEAHEFAVVTAYLFDGGTPGTVSTKRYFVYRDGATPMFKEFVG